LIGIIYCADNNVIFQSVHYPDNYNSALGGYSYVVSHNLMYSIVIYGNGTILTVGDASHNIAEPSITTPRVIRRFTVGSVSVSNFKSFVYGSGFLNLPAAKDGDKSNLICDTFYTGQYTSHKVCRPETMDHPTIVSINMNIDNLLNNYTFREVYKPNRIFVETKTVSSKDIKGVLISKSSKDIYKDFDPEGKFMKSDYSLSSYISYSTNYKIYNYVMDAANNQYSYTDGYLYFQFIVYIEGLSLNDHPMPFYPTSTYTYPTYDDNNNKSNVVGQIFLYGFLFIFFSFCVIFIIRRYFYKRNNNNESQEISIESSNNDMSNDQQPINPQMTTYPIFVQTNPQMNPQMSSYPIFVQTNPQMNPQMQSNIPIVFPHPQVFYPMHTNNNN
jgi:hypothetical protein